MRVSSIIALTLLAVTAGHADGGPDQTAVRIPDGTFESVLPPAPGVRRVEVAPFLLDRTPVTNAQFAQFVQRHPEWRRDRVARVFADPDYLSHWRSVTNPDAAIRSQPVVRVSWFAASAYCESRGMRLPTWYEWEYVAAASARSADARNDPAWRQEILSWYSRSARDGLAAVAATTANYYGVQDLHGVIWEWVHDLGGMLVAGDNREQSSSDDLRFQYRRLPDGGYNHSSVISLLTPQGEAAARSSVLGKVDETLLRALPAALDPAHAHDKPASLDTSIAAAAAAVARALQVECHAVHCIPVSAYPPGNLTTDRERLDRRMYSRMRRLIERAEVEVAAVHVVRGATADRLPKLARKLPAQILAIGVISRRWMKRLVIGDTAETLIRDAPCDLLLIKPHDFRLRLGRTRKEAVERAY